MASIEEGFLLSYMNLFLGSYIWKEGKVFTIIVVKLLLSSGHERDISNAFTIIQRQKILILSILQGGGKCY